MSVRESVPSLPLVESVEEKELRSTVRAMSRKLGPDYFQRVQASGEHADEQLRQLAESGLLETARLMSRKACLMYDLGLDPGELTNIAKVTGVDAGLAALDAAIQTHGGNGVALEYQLPNYWFLLRMLRIGPVSKEIVLNFVAERSLGLPRSY
jgi:alkylation response protein AidB-like acyl-CoA dehydrogenase